MFLGGWIDSVNYILDIQQPSEKRENARRHVLLLYCLHLIQYFWLRTKMHFIGKGKRKRERINRKKEKTGKLPVVSWTTVLYIKSKIPTCDTNKKKPSPDVNIFRTHVNVKAMHTISIALLFLDLMYEHCFIGSSFNVWYLFRFNKSKWGLNKC